MTLYVLRNPSGRFYVGVTAGLNKRVREHQQPSINPRRWTRSRGPWELMFSQEFADPRAARRAEGFVKRMKSRVFIEQLIAGERALRF